MWLNSCTYVTGFIYICDWIHLHMRQELLAYVTGFIYMCDRTRLHVLRCISCSHWLYATWLPTSATNSNVCDMTHWPMCDMTHSYVSRWISRRKGSLWQIRVHICGSDGFTHVALLHMCVTWLIHTCVTWLIHVHVTWLIHACVTWLIHACVTWLIHTCVGVSRVEKAPYGRDTCEWLIHICDMTHSHVWHDSFTHMWRDSFTHMWHDTFIRV